MARKRTVSRHDYDPFGLAFTRRLDAPLLVIGSQQWTRRQVVEDLRVGNLVAAGRLSTTLAMLEIRTIPAAYRHTPEDFTLVGVGDAQLYVLSAVFESAGLDVARWWNWTADPVKFSTRKARERKERTRLRLVKRKKKNAA